MMTARRLGLEAITQLPLVGRSDYIGDVKRRLWRLRDPTIYYLEGPGGVGKTALLESMLERFEREFRNRAVVARSIIDLYHIEYHTPMGLTEGIVDALGYASGFREYQRNLDSLRDSIRSGEVDKEDWKQTWGSFAKGLWRLTHGGDRPVVLALDTVEILEYVRDDFQRAEGLELPLASVADWFIDDLFSELRGPILWLWAGRPTDLDDRLKSKCSECSVEIVLREVQPLKKEESSQYLREVGRKLEASNVEGAERIRQYVGEYAAGLYSGTRGRPILLAMVADILRIGGDLPQIFYRQFPKGFINSEISRLDSILLRHLFRLPEPVGTILQSMGLLRKGCNASLLSRVMKVSEEQARAYLDLVGSLVLVKHRVRDERRLYFLHDEIYRLLDRYLRIEQERRIDFRDRILGYYDDREKALLDRLRLAPLRHNILRSRLRALEVERVHYHLQADPMEGFQAYFVSAEDALDSADHELDMLLRSEILRTLSELQEADRVPEDLSDWVKTDMAIRWGGRRLMIENDAKGAQAIFRKARDWLAEQGINYPATLDLYLQLYDAVTYLREQVYDEALQRLNRVRGSLDQIGDEDTTVLQLLRATTMAYLGYLERLQGRYQQAVRYYQQATRGYRLLNMGALISTLGNQAYAMAMVGRLRRARQIVREAHRRADDKVMPYWQAHALNNWGIVESMDGHSSTAIHHTDQALELLKVTEHERETSKKVNRLKALIYLTRGRTYRYQWNDYVRDQRWLEGWEKTIARSYTALEGDAGALKRLRDLKLHEPPENYYVEVLGESGCTFREMAWMRRHLEEELPEDEIRRVLHKGSVDWYHIFDNASHHAEMRLLEAAGIENQKDLLNAWESQVLEHASKYLGEDLYLPTLALVNLGFHWHYQREPSDRIAKLCDLIGALIPEAYQSPNSPMDKAEAELLLWSVLGKTEMLRFHEEMRGWRDLTEDQWKERIGSGVWHAMLSLEYNYLMGRDSFELRRAEDGLYLRITSLPEWDSLLLPYFYEYGQTYAEEFRPDDPESVIFMQWLSESFGEPEMWIS